jgi:hypothetical protein
MFRFSIVFIVPPHKIMISVARDRFYLSVLDQF